MKTILKKYSIIKYEFRSWLLRSFSAKFSIFVLVFFLSSWTASLSSCQSMFGSMVAVAFQITFRAEMHVNDVFLFFKNYF
jgi:hypothetical protein